MDLVSDLTAAQREAVEHLDGPLLILAAAGSGKTRVITRRVAHLLQSGVQPWNILAITFTNKAAGEMRSRVDDISRGHRTWISTFHSFGARIIRLYADRLGLDQHFTIYDQDDRKRIVKQVLEEARIDSIHFTPDRIQGAISRAKNKLLSPETFAERGGDYFDQIVAGVYPAYEKKLRAANALDFDDLLYWPAVALKKDPELRAELDERFQYVLIDEYQDTNYAQYAIARELTRDFANLCVVGDPDQSIYGWRGSDIRNILNFERDYPNARIITLDKNYRSTQRILEAADHLIKHNKRRKPKPLISDKEDGQPLVVNTYADENDEANGLARSIRGAVESGRRNYQDFAIFMRVNALSRALESAFLAQKVPYQIVRGLAFFERKENKDILAYLRLLLNPHDDISFLRIVNEPPRGVGKVSLKRLQDYAAPREMCLLEAAGQIDSIQEIRGKAVRGLAEFARVMHDLKSVTDGSAEEAIRDVLVKSGYRKMLIDSDDPQDSERLANIEELISAAQQWATEDQEDEFLNLESFLEHVTLVSDIDGLDDEKDQVSIMTLHAAKGLEFPVVHMIAMEQGLLPHDRSLSSEEEVEEERRLAFVGITRAKEEVYLSHVRERTFRGMTLHKIASPFLDELPRVGVKWEDRSAESTGWSDPFDDGYEFDDVRMRPGTHPRKRDSNALKPRSTRQIPNSKPKAKQQSNQSPKMTLGSLVKHAHYGVGKISNISGTGAACRVKIYFPKQGEKTFVLEKAPIELIGS